MTEETHGRKDYLFFYLPSFDASLPIYLLNVVTEETHCRKDLIFVFFLLMPDYRLDCQLVMIAVSHVL